MPTLDPAENDASLSEAVTDRILIVAQSTFLPEHSKAPDRWAFSYTVTITNGGNAPVTLIARHIVTTDATGAVDDKRGPGVNGYQPRLLAGESFTYATGAILRTAQGNIGGDYLMKRDDGTRFDAPIPPLSLSAK